MFFIFILDIDAYEQLLEDVADTYLGALAQKNSEQETELVAHSEVKKKVQKRK